MIKYQLKACALKIPFNDAFEHASARRCETQSIWVQATAGIDLTGYGESCPRLYVSGETVNSALTFFQYHKSEIQQQIWNLESLRNWVKANEKLIDESPAAWCAIELALLDLFAKCEGKSIEQSLGTAPLTNVYQYSAILGGGSVEKFAQQLSVYLAKGFQAIKIKLSGHFPEDLAKCQILRAELPINCRVRADANNLWRTPEQASRYLDRLNYPFWAIEEPLPAFDFIGMQRLAVSNRTIIILDESFLNAAQFAELEAHPKTWILNLRISKCGGLLRTLNLIKIARDMEIPLIIGAQVGETSVLTRFALTAATAAHDILLAQEGAFGTYLLRQDVTDTSLRFGKSAKLKPEIFNLAQQPGLGFAINSATIDSASKRRQVSK